MGWTRVRRGVGGKRDKEGVGRQGAGIRDKNGIASEDEPLHGTPSTQCQE